MITRRTFPLILCALASACATRVATTRPVRSGEQEFLQLQVTQRVFREQNTVPQSFDFPGHGRVTVREITLDGFPGNTYLRCRFHYENRTDEPIVQAWVMLDVVAPNGRLVASQATACIMPIPMAVARGAYVADELRVQTHGVHLQPGWSWRIRCVAERYIDDPLDPPVQESQWPPIPPLIIKNRGQNNDVYDSGSGYDVGPDGVRTVGGRGVGNTYYRGTGRIR